MFETTLYVIWSQLNAFQHKNAGPAACLWEWKSQEVIINKSAFHKRHHKSASHRRHHE